MSFGGAAGWPPTSPAPLTPASVPDADTRLRRPSTSEENETASAPRLGDLRRALRLDALERTGEISETWNNMRKLDLVCPR